MISGGNALHDTHYPLCEFTASVAGFESWPSNVYSPCLMPFSSVPTDNFF